MPRNVNNPLPSPIGVRKHLRSALFKMVEVKRGLVLGLPGSGHHYGTVRQYNSRTPVAGGGSIAFHFMGWRADAPMPSCDTVLKLIDTLKKYELHCTVEQVDRVHTNLTHGHGKTVTSLVVTLKWREGFIQKASDEYYSAKSKVIALPCPPHSEPVAAQTFTACPPPQPQD